MAVNPIAALAVPVLTRRSWARLEARAITGFERDLLATIDHLAERRTPIVALDVRDDGLGSIRAVLGERTLLLTGVSEPARAAVTQVGPDAPGPRLQAVGRYGRAWWVTIQRGATVWTLLGTRLRLVPTGGGLGGFGGSGVGGLGPQRRTQLV